MSKIVNLGTKVSARFSNWEPWHVDTLGVGFSHFTTSPTGSLQCTTVGQSESSDGEKWCNVDDLVKRDKLVCAR